MKSMVRIWEGWSKSQLSAWQSSSIIDTGFLCFPGTGVPALHDRCYPRKGCLRYRPVRGHLKHDFTLSSHNLTTTDEDSMRVKLMSHLPKGLTTREWTAVVVSQRQWSGFWSGEWYLRVSNVSSEKGNYSICYIDIFRLYFLHLTNICQAPTLYYSRYLGQISEPKWRHSVPRTDSDTSITCEYKEEESYLSEVV